MISQEGNRAVTRIRRSIPGKRGHDGGDRIASKVIRSGRPRASPTARGRWWQSSLAHDFGVAALTGLLVASASVLYQSHLDNERQNLADIREDARQLQSARQENFRFVRDRSSSKPMERPFATIDLEGQNLAGLTLNKADFTDANLRSVELVGTKVREGTFFRTDLTDAIMLDSDLSSSNFHDTNLSGADMAYADLSDAYFYRGNFSDVDFNASNMKGVVLESTNLKGAYMNNTDLRGANLSTADLSDAILEDEPLNYSANKGVGMLLATPEPQYNGVCYDKNTKWPNDFNPPPSDVNICREWDQKGNLIGVDLWDELPSIGQTPSDTE